MTVSRPEHPEPVPSASQLSVLPFLAAIAGFLARNLGDTKFRITMHRVMSREGDGYLQQICSYIGRVPVEHEKAGRIFPVGTGIMGSAFQKRRVIRTRNYPTLADLRSDLAEDLKEIGSAKRPEEVAISYAAIPFLGSSDSVPLVLYAECGELNFFADDGRIIDLIAMCEGFCRLFDWLQEARPFTTLRNFPLERGELKYSPPTVYRRLQEELNLKLPRFRTLESFNYEASVA